MSAASGAGATAEPTFVGLSADHIDAAALYRRVCLPSCGAVATFHGITRDSFQGREVVRLEYEAYAAMAEKQMAKIAEAMRAQWPSVRGIAMQHRTGVVPVTEASIVICVSSPHRVDSMAACRFAIDQVKTVVPVWKREVYADGSRWKENSEFLSGPLFRRGKTSVERAPSWWSQPAATLTRGQCAAIHALAAAAAAGVFLWARRQGSAAGSP
eukprot:TRINITY_DN9014_c2_g1_i1.p2 TRINITY_DN9014_c2_g1~~TRINITY_DN9014_c2_g1_i1.p2  ORF type:complete len:239 (+),score=74.54 TRINITY_DN9014_c2_g1_i1:79-717(+)